MESMEKESGFLSKGESKALLAHILPQILADLTLHGECTIPVNAANIINLKLFPKLQDPAQVFDYQVPVAIRDLRLLLENSGASESKSDASESKSPIIGLTLGCSYSSRVGPRTAADRAVHRRRQVHQAHQLGG